MLVRLIFSEIALPDVLADACLPALIALLAVVLFVVVVVAVTLPSFNPFGDILFASPLLMSLPYLQLRFCYRQLTVMIVCVTA